MGGARSSEIGNSTENILRSYKNTGSGAGQQQKNDKPAPGSKSTRSQYNIFENLKKYASVPTVGKMSQELIDHDEKKKKKSSAATQLNKYKKDGESSQSNPNQAAATFAMDMAYYRKW